MWIKFTKNILTEFAQNPWVPRDTAGFQACAVQIKILPGSLPQFASGIRTRPESVTTCHHDARLLNGLCYIALFLLYTCPILLVYEHHRIWPPRLAIDEMLQKHFWLWKAWSLRSPQVTKNHAGKNSRSGSPCRSWIRMLGGLSGGPKVYCPWVDFRSQDCPQLIILHWTDFIW